MELSPDLDLVADVIEHIDKNGEPGNKWCLLCKFFFRSLRAFLFLKMHLSVHLSVFFCFRCNIVLPPWVAGHQGRAG